MSPQDNPFDPTGERGHLASPSRTWVQTRDAHLASFIAQRLTHVSATGCTEEKKTAAGIQKIFDRWNRLRETPETGSDLSATEISLLGWSLRCLACAAWRGAPGWDPSFHPEATGPASWEVLLS